MSIPLCARRPARTIALVENLVAEHGLALLASSLCLVLGFAVGLPLLLLWGMDARESKSCLSAVALLALPLAASIGAWMVVGSPGDWAAVVRSVGAAAAACLVLALSLMVEDQVWWRLGPAGRSVWPLVVALAGAAGALAAWLAVAVWLPGVFALAVAVLAILAILVGLVAVAAG